MNSKSHSFSDLIEKFTGQLDDVNIPAKTAHIYDGMVLIQQTSSVALETFGDLSNFLFSRITKSAEVIYFVTDRYLPGSIKSYERGRRQNSGSIRYRIERREQKRTKQWMKYLKDSTNKYELIKFLLDDWSDSSRFAKQLRERPYSSIMKTHFTKLLPLMIRLVELYCFQ